jgi:hypothetical protein
MKKKILIVFENAQIMPHEKIDLATCINIKASIMDDRDFFFNLIFFLKMHKCGNV